MADFALAAVNLTVRRLVTAKDKGASCSLSVDLAFGSVRRDQVLAA
jgi:hypothetical protein